MDLEDQSWGFSPPVGMQRLPYSSSPLVVADKHTYTPASSSSTTELWLFRVPLDFSIETLDAVKIPKRTTQACTSVKIKQAALEPGAKHTTTTYDLLDLAHAHAPANTTLDAGETADMVLIHPSNSDHALTVSGRGFDRVYLISPSDRVETEAHVDGLVHAGIQALNVPYTPREPQVGLGLQSLPFGFDSDDRLVEASFPRRRAAAYSDKEKGSLKAKSVSKTGTASVSKAVKTSRKEGSRKRTSVAEQVPMCCFFSPSQIVLEPYEYLIQHPGQEIRNLLIQGFQKWMQVPPVKLEVIKKVVAMLHTASLLVDDVEDGSDLRRGVPVTHKIFGVASTINAANYVYFVALEMVLTLNDPRVVVAFTEELQLLHLGQGMEIHWRDTVTCPSEAEYLDMVGNKTGGLLRLGVRLMQLCGTPQLAEPEDPLTASEYIRLVNRIGVYYQVRDDYLNLKSAKYHDRKGYAEDLTEGKFSYPIVRCILKDPSSKSQLCSILRQRTRDQDVKKYAIEIIEAAGVFSDTETELFKMEQQTRAMIARLGGNTILERIVDSLSACYTTERVEAKE
ncbi:hypothetical protein BASA60_003949 [Batrachochytrium salamandrivorans]|nr:hypothetical protein BASA60_003949 [Batrachochytrium salamandrivorans]